jgi:hypothetical protein
MLRRIEKVDLWQLWQLHEERELTLFKELKQLISWDELNQHFMKYFGWQGHFLVEDKGGDSLSILKSHGSYPSKMMITLNTRIMFY